MKNFCLTTLGLLFSVLLMADVSLPQIFGDNMVLQRNQPIPVWGWAAPNERVTVQFNQQSVRTKADKDGKWLVRLRQEAAGGPFVLTVTGKNKVEVKNVLVGEVWLCSGQSNMEMMVKHSSDNRYAEDIRKASNDQIRHFKVPHVISDTPVADIPEGDWKLGNDSANVADFSSAGYFFAQKLYEELKVPVGLINSSWGGTMVETWISREALDQHAEFKNSVQKSFNEIKSAIKDREPWANDYPSLSYNAMLHPLIPYAIRGALWYQGETNAVRASQYSKSFPLMITDWRSKWKQGDFPFYFVQLASFQADNGNSTTGSKWAELRESQTSTLSLPNTGMAVALDIGDTKDIHPANKKDVGLRLAAIALNKVYEKQEEFSGPVYDKFSIEGNKAIVHFKHANGLMARDKYGYLKGFEVAGNDQKFYYAKAQVENGRVVVHSDSVATPVAVRYGWADDMPEANLYNQEGFPAVPFRTDDWKRITEGERFVVK